MGRPESGARGTGRAIRARPLAVGVIGCGGVAAARHLPALGRSDSARVVAVADLDADRLERVADRFDIERRYAHPDALLADPGVEAVAVCVPAEHHVGLALAAIEAGKHVLVEKPLALSLDETDRLVQRARESSVAVAVGFNLRFHRLVRRARQLLDGGAVGPLEAIRTALTSSYSSGSVPAWRTRRRAGGGALIEKGVHHYDLWRFLAQGEVEEVYALSRSDEADDVAATVTARLDSGAFVSSVLGDRTSPSNELTIYGRLGRLEVCLHRFDGLRLYSGARISGNVVDRLRGAAGAARDAPGAAREALRGGVFLASFREEWRQFADAVRRGREPPCGLEDGRRALEVALAAAHSAATGRPVRVADAPRGLP